MKFVFDEKTGTMVPSNPVLHELSKQSVSEPIKTAKPVTEVPVVNKYSMLEGMQRPKHNVVVDEPIVQFHEYSDKDVVQIIDNDTGRLMGYIAGYALDVQFNMDELRSVEKIEKFLDGWSKYLRSVILKNARLANEV